MIVRAFSFAFLLALATASAALADHQDNVGKDHLAVQGYDVVAYFAAGKAAKGDKAITATHGGHVYRFANEANRKKFIEAPDKYIPHYGGWCATAMAEGRKVEIDPTNFKITNGRLFLFYKSFFANALTDWNKDESRNITKADEHWKRLNAH